MKEILSSLVRGVDLSPPQMERAVGLLMDGRATQAQIGAFLAALRQKGESIDELTAAVHVIRSRAVPLGAEGPLLDTCGTGGDGRGTFNISTATAFVAAAAGVRVAKHGNRAASGSVGAADVLETLGARIEMTPGQALSVLERTGITFLFAPNFHPAFRHVAAARKELGFRTLFNLTGPLCNPAGASRQLVGLFAREWMRPVGEVFLRLGCDRVMIVHGADGSDEMTTTGPTFVVEVSGENIREFSVSPSDVGLAEAEAADLKGGDAETNAAILRSLLGGESGPRADVVALNAGAALYVGGKAATIGDGVASARRLLRAGTPLERMQAFIAATRETTA